ncbi:hypothetical protein D3C78_693500 [compost metagenome]
MDTAGGDYRDLGGSGQSCGERHVAALHHAVFGDVGVDDGRDAVGFETLGQVDDLHRADFSPAVGGDEAVFGIQAHDHFAREGAAGFGNELWLLDRLGTDDHVADAGLDVVLDGFQRTDAATDLDRQGRVALGNRGDHFTVDRLAFEGAVEVNQMQPAAAPFNPFGGHAHRVVREYRGVFHAALAQAYASTVLEIDSGDNQHLQNLSIR